MAELIAKTEGLEACLDKERPIPLLQKNSQLTSSHQVTTKDPPRCDAKEVFDA